MEYHPAGHRPLIRRRVGPFNRDFSFAALRLGPSRLADSGPLPGAVLADGTIFSGSEPPHRGTPSRLRSLVNAPDGRNLGDRPHRLWLDFGTLLPFLLPSGAAWASRPLCCRPTRSCRELLAGRSHCYLSLLRDHSIRSR